MTIEKSFMNTSKTGFNLILNLGNSQVQFFLPKDGILTLKINEETEVEFKAAEPQLKNFELQEIP